MFVLKACFLLTIFLSSCLGFYFRQLTITANSKVVGEITQYTIRYTRDQDNNGNKITLSPVPSQSNITVTFPDEYSINSPTCLSVILQNIPVIQYSCMVDGNTVIIGAITSDQMITNVQLVIGNILNPTPAVTTGQFQGTIGTDFSQSNTHSHVDLIPANFKNCIITFQNPYVNQTSTMILTLTPRNAINQDSFIVISLPKHWTNDIQTNSILPISSTMNCISYSSEISSQLQCQGFSSNSSIVVTKILTSQTSQSFAFGITEFVSPPTVYSDSITISSMLNQNQIDTCNVPVTGLLPNSFLAISITPLSTMYINTMVSIKIQLTLPDTMNTQDQVVITFPNEIQPIFIGLSGIAQFSSPPGFLNGQTLTSNHNTSNIRNYYKGQVYSLNFQQIKSPPSSTVSNPITVQIVRNGAQKMLGTTTMQAIPSILTGSVTPAQSKVNKITNYMINFTMIDGISSTGMIKIDFPSSIRPSLSSQCASLIGSNVVNWPTCTYNPENNFINLTNLNSSAAAIQGGQTLQLTVLSVKNAPSVAPSGPFMITTFYTNKLDSIVSQGNISGITAHLDIIDSLKVVVNPSSYKMSDTLVTYTISFVIGNDIPEGGFIQVTIPSPINLDIENILNQCTISINSSQFSKVFCTGRIISDGYFVNFTDLNLNKMIPQSTNISLQISNLFTNPNTPAVVSSFTIKTYSNDSYGIEQIISGIQVQMRIPTLMTSMSVTRNSSTNSDSFTEYTIRLKQVTDLPNQSTLIINFPQQISLSNSIVTCTDLSGQTILSCSQLSNSLIVPIPRLVPANSEFGVVVTNVLNPPSFAPLSSDFYFETQGLDKKMRFAKGQYFFNEQNKIQSSFLYISGQFSPKIYGQSTVLQVLVIPSGKIIPHYLKVTIPPSFTIPNSLSCSSWQCSAITFNQINVTKIASEVRLTISGMYAPTSSTSDYITASSYDINGYQMDKSNNQIIFSAACSLPCRTCTETNSSACLSCYTTGNIEQKYLSTSTSSCYSVCPTGTYTNMNIFICLDCSSICSSCNSSPTNCNSCDPNSEYPYLFMNESNGSCLNKCPIHYYPDLTLTPFVCNHCQNHCLTCNNIDECTSCQSGFYYYQSKCSQSCPQKITISNSETNNCDPCSLECATCVETVDNCLECSAIAVSYLDQCVIECPPSMIIKNGNCSLCSSNCLTCSITDTNCSSCNTSSKYPFFYNNNCFQNCPIYHYQQLANGQCILCSTLNIGCSNCTSSSTCGSCDLNQGLVFLNNRCYKQTPEGYYNNTGNAQPCSSSKDCATCMNLADNCTSCLNLNLQGNQCIKQCNSGKVDINKLCIPCLQNCLTCSSLQSNCTSCSSPLYLSNFQCVTTCPDYTYPQGNQCISCNSPCEKCLNSTHCQSCLSGYNFMDNAKNCNITCQNGFLGINRICRSCISPCSSCQLALNMCTSCESTYYLIKTTHQCVETCPSQLFPDDTQHICIGCRNNCLTCKDSSQHCTSCSDSYKLFNATCNAFCPFDHYSLDNTCYPCNQNCMSCISAAVCIKCVSGYYLYNKNCLDRCPAQQPVASANGQCSNCSSNCITCTYKNQCSRCNNFTYLFHGNCVEYCPSKLSNGTNCIQEQNTSQHTSQQKSNSLLSISLFPVPLTVTAAIIGIACIMSKFQHVNTFVGGTLYSLWSLLQMGSIGVTAYFYFEILKTRISLSFQDIEALIFIGAVIYLYLLNFLSFIFHLWYLRLDAAFGQWQHTQLSNRFCYYVTTFVGLTVTHKFKNIMFCKLFGCQIFQSKLDSVNKFKIFNIFSYLSFLSSGGILIAVSLIIYHHHLLNQQMMAYIDTIVLTIACIILTIFNSRKSEQFFDEKDNEKVRFPKRVQQSSDFIMKEAISPFISENLDNVRVGNTNKTQQIYESQLKFKNNLDEISDSPFYGRFQLGRNKENVQGSETRNIEEQSKMDILKKEQNQRKRHYYFDDETRIQKRNIAKMNEGSKQLQNSSIEQKNVGQHILTKLKKNQVLDNKNVEITNINKMAMDNDEEGSNESFSQPQEKKMTNTNLNQTFKKQGKIENIFDQCQLIDEPYKEAKSILQSFKSQKSLSSSLSNKQQDRKKQELLLSNQCVKLGQKNMQQLKQQTPKNLNQYLNQSGNIESSNNLNIANKKQILPLNNDVNEQLSSAFDKSSTANFKSTVKKGYKGLPNPHSIDNNNEMSQLSISSNMDSSVSQHFQEIISHPIKPQKECPIQSRLNNQLRADLQKQWPSAKKFKEDNEGKESFRRKSLNKNQKDDKKQKQDLSKVNKNNQK